MPRWKPAENKGEKVRSYYTLPVMFEEYEEDTKLTRKERRQLRRIERAAKEESR